MIIRFSKFGSCEQNEGPVNFYDKSTSTFPAPASLIWKSPLESAQLSVALSGIVNLSNEISRFSWLRQFNLTKFDSCEENTGPFNFSYKATSTFLAPAGLGWRSPLESAQLSVALSGIVNTSDEISTCLARFDDTNSKNVEFAAAVCSKWHFGRRTGMLDNRGFWNKAAVVASEVMRN